MTMSTWVIISWVVVAIMIAVNIVIFLKLKKASEQMLKMAFPNAKNMNDALSQMQGMMGAFQGASHKGKGKGRGGSPFGPGMSRGGSQDAQLKAAMDMLKKIQKK